MLGGGLLPGSLTVVLGATGIGKSQLGVQFAHHGLQQEGEAGIFFDLATRGDSQNQLEYAERLCNWKIDVQPVNETNLQRDVWNRDAVRKDYLHIFRRSGRKVTFRDLDPDDWKEWKIELAKKLDQTIEFFYGNFIHGVRRCVIDGVEPTDQASDSFQMNMFEYIYHQILRKEADWVARDYFRAHFRENEEKVQQHLYDHQDIACVILLTSHEVLLDHLIEKPLESGDLLINANTIIQMGKTRNPSGMGRALHVAKHRGSACDSSIVPFTISNNGIQINS